MPFTAEYSEYSLLSLLEFTPYPIGPHSHGPLPRVSRTPSQNSEMGEQAEAEAVRLRLMLMLMLGASMKVLEVLPTAQNEYPTYIQSRLWRFTYRQ